VNQDVLRLNVAVDQAVGMSIFQAGQDLPQDCYRVADGHRLGADQRPQARTGDVLHREVRRVGIGVKTDGADDVRMHQPVDGHALALQLPEILRISWDFDGDELVDPHVVVGAPHLSEGPAADLLVEEVFSDALTGCGHVHPSRYR
jgi:hypothetical protein